MRTESQKADDIEYLLGMATLGESHDSGFTTVDREALITVLAELDAYKAAVTSVLNVPPYSPTDPGTDDFKAGFNHRTQCDRNIINRKLNGRK